MEDVFASGATTSGRMDKRRPRLDSARRIGLESPPHESFDCSDDVSTGSEVQLAEFPKSGHISSSCDVSHHNVAFASRCHGSFSVLFTCISPRAFVVFVVSSIKS